MRFRSLIVDCHRGCLARLAVMGQGAVLDWLHRVSKLLKVVFLELGIGKS